MIYNNAVLVAVVVVVLKLPITERLSPDSAIIPECAVQGALV